MKYDAVVLAGSPNRGRLRECSSVENEALIPIGNRVMLDYVVAALLKAKSVGRLVIVGPKIELQKLYGGNSRIMLAESGSTVIDSLKAGIQVLKPQSHILVTTGDIPLLSQEAVDNFIAKCTDREVDVYYPIVPREINERQYPQVKRTYVNLKEGTFTGGNIFLVNPFKVDSCAEKGNQLVNLRKSPLALSRQIGLLFILKFLLKRLSLSEVELQFSKLLSIKGKAIVLDYPEIGIDVDKPSDLELVRKILA
ncbi:MAG: nucleotidyltransferase family protein [Zhaonellaceae bacterium]|nr:NTP transferase domain-containing protein [Clostridia bacterium]